MSFMLMGVSGTSGSGATAWAPTDLGAPLEIWFDAADSSSVTESSGAVSQWSDKSGNARHATQATGANKPDYSATGINTSYPAIVFGGGGAFDYIDTSTFNVADNNELAAFVVATQTTSASGKRLLSYTEAGQSDFNSTTVRGIFVYNSDGVDRLDAYRNGALSGVAKSGATPFIIGSIFDSTNHTMWLNGTTGTPVASTGTFGSASTYLSIANSGSNPALGAELWVGAIASIILVSGALTTLNRQKIEGYLAHRYGLQASLPGGHPYLAAPP